MSRTAEIREWLLWHWWQVLLLLGVAGGFITAAYYFFRRGLRGRNLMVRFLAGTGLTLLLTVLWEASFLAAIWLRAWDMERKGDQPSGLAAPALDLPAGTSTYTALGDSFSAGEGLGDYFAGTGDSGDRCHRSQHAYSQKLQFTRDVKIVFRACSGARLPDLSDAFGLNTATDNSLGLQLDEGLDASVGLVTLTIGGNDSGFANLLEHCARKTDCMSQVFDDSFDDGQASGLPLEVWAKRRVASLSGDLQRAYALIRNEIHPQARVVVLGYPNLFPMEWDPEIWDSDCAAVVSTFSVPEMQAFLRLEDVLFDGMARSAHQASVDFVDVRRVFNGHEPCGQDTPPRWFAFFRTSKGLTIHPGNFHPTRSGQEAYARAVACHLLLTETGSHSADDPEFVACARDGEFEPDPPHHN